MEHAPIIEPHDNVLINEIPEVNEDEEDEFDLALDIQNAYNEPVGLPLIDDDDIAFDRL